MNAPPLAIGSCFARRFQIAGILGEGGMARVYRARDAETGHDVALKVLPASASGDLEARFDREARNALRLDHPGCVRVLATGRAVCGSRFIAMEKLDGGTLRDELAGDELPVERAVAIARELCEGLAHAHARGVIHRDLKPENVMIAGPERRAVLIDFGLSELEGDAALTASGSCVGSPSYLAPERILGRDYDGRADLYAVGVMLFEMLTGERPFSGDSPLETARHHLEKPPPSVTDLRPDAPAALAAICAMALEKRPEARFRDAEHMAGVLADACRARETAPAPRRKSPWWRRALAIFGGDSTNAPTPAGDLSLAGSGAMRL